MRKSILFLSHEASRTGAPMVLLHLLRWLKAHTDLGLRVLLAADGPLRRDFEQVAETIVEKELDRRVKRNLVQRVLRKTGIAYQEDYRFDPLRALSKSEEIGLIYANTVASAPLLVRLQHLNVPVIVHIHELDTVISVYGGWPACFGKADVFIAASESVKESLIRRYAVPDERIETVHEFIFVDDISPSDGARQSIRTLLGIPPDAILVGGVGVAWWRKGIDLFVQVAHRVCNLEDNKNVHFLWVGISPDPVEYKGIRHDIAKSGLDKFLHFAPSTERPFDIFAAFDILATISREDPFPLVNLECAALGIPIVCFDASGGSREFVGRDAGFVVPYLDLDQFARKIIQLAKNPDLRHRLGAAGASKVRKYDVSEAGPRILSIIRRVSSLSE